MITTININNKMNMISEMENDSKFQVLEYEQLRGGNTIKTAMNINKLNELGLTLKQVRVVLYNNGVILQNRALSFMKGNISAKNNSDDTHKFKIKIFNFRESEREIVKPYFNGVGEIFLEPSFEYFTLIQLEDEEIIINDSIFYACEEVIEIFKVNEGLLDDKEISQLRLKGNGIVVLKIPVPENEILRCKLFEDKLIISNEFVVLRTGKINISEEEIDNKLVNVYGGVGDVWLIPSRNIYDYIENLGSKDNAEEEQYYDEYEDKE